MMFSNKSTMLAVLLPWVMGDDNDWAGDEGGPGRSIVNPSTERTQSPLMMKAYTESLLEDFLQYESSIAAGTIENLVNHGCWCAKLTTSPFLSYLKVRNPEPVDMLDGICRDWMRMRNCNDELSGGSCVAADSLENGSYTLSIDSSNASSSFCESGADTCSMDTCQIDLHFMKQIKDFLVSNDGQSWNLNEVVSDGVCVGVTPQDEDRICTGSAPALQAVVAPVTPTEPPKTAEQVMSEKITNAVKDAGGSMCDASNPNCLQVKLYWDNTDGTRNNFDIAVSTPSGKFLWWAAKNADGGVCDIDSNLDHDNPVENVYFADVTNYPGKYRIHIRNYEGAYGPINAWVEVTRGNGYRKLYPVSMTRGQVIYDLAVFYI